MWVAGWGFQYAYSGIHPLASPVGERIQVAGGHVASDDFHTSCSNQWESFTGARRVRKDTNRSPMPGVDEIEKMGFVGKNEWRAICGRYIGREDESGCTERGTELAKQGVKDGEFKPTPLLILGYIIHLPCENMSL